MGEERLHREGGLKRKRPLVVTLLCILGFIEAPVQIFAAFIATLPAWYAVMSIMFALLYVIGLVFVWKMKKWGLIVYTVVKVINVLLFFSIDKTIDIPLLSIAIVVVLWTQFRKMS